MRKKLTAALTTAFALVGLLLAAPADGLAADPGHRNELAQVSGRANTKNPGTLAPSTESGKPDIAVERGGLFLLIAALLPRPPFLKQ
jgi:hypothetical protein